jgi:hypothetical protein
MSRRPLRIIFSGMIAADPNQGGATWAVLQYLLGLRRLGHDVWFVEPVPRDKWQPAEAAPEQSVNARYFHEVMSEFGLERTSALLLTGARETVGVPYPTLADVASTADLLVNVSGMLTDPLLTGPAAVRLYLDLDPAFVQLWHTSGQADMRFAGHTHFATVGLEIGRHDGNCAIPTCGVQWIHTLPPVVLEHWPVASGVGNQTMTTIANWRSYGSLHHDGVFYGQKAHSFRGLIDLPTRARAKFALALSIHPDEKNDLASLRRFGWQLLDPLAVAGSPSTYKQFITESWAELGVAKEGYVTSRCGWLSDRSVCYLAAGRPVLAQDTGFSRDLPTTGGLLSFSTTDQAVAAIDHLRSDYQQHSVAARRLAENYFNSDKVLTRLLEHLGVGR